LLRRTPLFGASRATLAKLRDARGTLFIRQILKLRTTCRPRCIRHLRSGAALALAAPKATLAPSGPLSPTLPRPAARSASGL
jgi:hypothetical protein